MDHERCAACGFDGSHHDEESLIRALRALGSSWRVLLAKAGRNLRLRPAPDVWSAIEYAAHSRDVTALHVFGVEQALTQDEPAHPPIGDDLAESAAATYGHADPERVAFELAAQASLLANVAEQAGAATWSRGLTVGDSRSDVRRLLEHALHDSLHHLADVENGLNRLRETEIR
ncbi:MAG TPA: DinB family protein [Acidimicrobiales bacterium]|nr:DinB family protein [Acidimicrobiales bacterium]